MSPEEFKLLYITGPSNLDINLSLMDDSSLYYIDFTIHQLEYLSKAEENYKKYSVLYDEYIKMDNNYTSDGQYFEYTLINKEEYLLIKRESKKILVQQRDALENFYKYTRNLKNTVKTYKSYDAIKKRTSNSTL